MRKLQLRSRVGLIGLSFAVFQITALGETAGLLRAGAAAMDITPREFPVRVSGSFLERTTSEIKDRLHARCVVLDDGRSRIAIVVIDNCVIPRDVLDRAKQLAARATGIPEDRMLMSATHTHSGPALTRYWDATETRSTGNGSRSPSLKPCRRPRLNSCRLGSAGQW